MHYKAYADNGNKLLEGSGFEGKSLEEVVKGPLARTPVSSTMPASITRTSGSG
jgi:hypothetical protein